MRRLSLAVICVSMMLASCAEPTAPTVDDDAKAVDDEAASRRARTDYYYDGAATISPDTGNIDLEWLITVNGDQEDITFLFNPTLGDFSVSGPDVVSYVAEAVDTFGGMTAVKIALAPAEAGAMRVFSLSYGGVLIPEPMPNKINMISPDKIELTVDSFWAPFDARFNQLITADLDLIIDGEWTIVSPGDVREEAGSISISYDEPTMDLPVMLLKGATRTDAPGYAIYDTREVRENIPALINAAGFCTDYLNAAFGAAKPLPTAEMVIHDRDIGGYSRKTVISLTDIAETEEQPLLQFICHELAHFWSSGANFNSSDHWLTESFADYVAMMGMREAYGVEPFEARLQHYRDQVANAEGGVPPIWTPENTARGPYLVNYRKGPLALAQLEEMLGAEKFNAFVFEYMTRPINTTPDLLDALEEIAGAEARAAFEGMLAA